MNRAADAPRRSGFDPLRDTVSLAGGSRVRGRRHAGAAITAPNAGAFLTGLATAVASVPAGISCPRRYHCPFVGCLLSCLPSNAITKMTREITSTAADLALFTGFLRETHGLPNAASVCGLRPRVFSALLSAGARIPCSPESCGYLVPRVSRRAVSACKTFIFDTRTKREHRV